MCGIVGVFSYKGNGIGSSEAKVARQLTLVDQLRGQDGTGIFFRKILPETSKDIPLRFYKKPVTASEFLGQADWNRMVMGSRFLVAHNRAATIGALDEESTHPFDYPNVLGVHNGTVRGWKWMMREHINKAEMDSSAIYESLSKLSPDVTEVGEFLASIESGAYSLVWYDSRVDELRFARNGDRPMNLVRTSQNLWFGSELRMLEWVLDRNHATIQSAFSTAEHTLICLPVNGGEATYHDYSEETLDVGKSQSSWGSAWDNYTQGYDRPYTPGTTTTFRGSRAPDSFPIKTKWFTAMSWSLVSLPASCCYQARNAVLSKLHEVTGVSPGKQFHFKDVPAALANRLNTGCDGSVVDMAKGRMYAPVRITHMDNDLKIYGYLPMKDGSEIPVSFTQSQAFIASTRIREILDSGKEVIYPDCRMFGVRVFWHGQVSYTAGLCTAHPKDLLVGESLTDTPEGEIRAIFAGTHHPDITKDQSKDINWNTGWLSH